MSTLMDDEIKRWTARRKSALVLEIIQGKTTVAEASRACDIPPSEIEKWLEDGRRGMENALRGQRLKPTFFIDVSIIHASALRFETGAAAFWHVVFASHPLRTHSSQQGRRRQT